VVGRQDAVSRPAVCDGIHPVNERTSIIWGAVILGLGGITAILFLPKLYPDGGAAAITPMVTFVASIIVALFAALKSSDAASKSKESADNSAANGEAIKDVHQAIKAGGGGTGLSTKLTTNEVDIKAENVNVEGTNTRKS